MLLVAPSLAAPPLAHLGGVPEALSIGVPLLAVVGFVLLERSARRKAREREAEHDGDS